MTTYEKYKRLIKAGKFTEQELISFRKYINGSSPLDTTDRAELTEYFIMKAEDIGIKLSFEQQLKGLNWLKSKT